MCIHWLNISLLAVVIIYCSSFGNHCYRIWEYKSFIEFPIKNKISVALKDKNLKNILGQ